MGYHPIVCALPQVDQHALAQLICLNGMITDPNKPGTEKLTATNALPQWLVSPRHQFEVGPTEPGIRGSGLAMPSNIFMVKGWNRSASLMMVLYACYDVPDLRKVLAMCDTVTLM